MLFLCCYHLETSVIVLFLEDEFGQRLNRIGMISPEQLHAFLEKLDKGVAAVDLLKIGQNYALNSAHQAYNGKVSLFSISKTF